MTTGSGVIGALLVSLGVDTAAFSEGLKGAKSELGGFAGIAKNLAGMAMAGIAAAAAAAGTAIVAMGHQALEGATEIQRAAQISNSTAVEFQKMAAGARTVGIEQEELADILKDVNDRVGDFLITGGGPMADFFEKIAPKIGVTAEQFRNLSGPQALQLYVSSLEKAGVNQQQMTFFMEAMASNSTKLIPLLKDGGIAMTQFGEAAQASGRIMSEEMVTKLAAAKLTIDNTTASLGQMATVFAGEAIIAAMDFAEQMAPVFEQVKAVGVQIMEFLMPSINRMTEAFRNFGEGPAGKAVLAVLQAIAGVMVGAMTIGLKVAIEGFTLFLNIIDRVMRFIGPMVQRVVGAFNDLKRFLGLQVEPMQKAADAYKSAAETVNAAPKLPKLIIPTGGGAVKSKAGSAKPQAKPNNDFAWRQIEPGESFEAASEKVELYATGLGKVSTIMDGLPEKYDALKEAAEGFGGELKDGLKDMLRYGGSVGDMLKNIALRWAESQISSGIDLLFKSFKIPGFATGTNSAPEGFAMVGERGPELVRFGGGEKVFNASRTRDIMSGSTGDRPTQAFYINAQGAVLANGLIAEMREVGIQAAVAGAQGGADLSRAQEADRSRHYLD